MNLTTLTFDTQVLAIICTIWVFVMGVVAKLLYNLLTDFKEAMKSHDGRITKTEMDIKVLQSNETRALDHTDKLMEHFVVLSQKLLEKIK